MQLTKHQDSPKPSRKEKAIIGMLDYDMPQLIIHLQAQFEIAHGCPADIIFLHPALRTSFIQQLYQRLKKEGKIIQGEVLASDAIIFNYSIVRFFLSVKVDTPWIRLMNTFNKQQTEISI